jgi:hypothetical protein
MGRGETWRDRSDIVESWPDGWPIGREVPAKVNDTKRHPVTIQEVVRLTDRVLHTTHSQSRALYPWASVANTTVRLILQPGLCGHRIGRA